MEYWYFYRVKWGPINLAIILAVASTGDRHPTGDRRRFQFTSKRAYLANGMYEITQKRSAAIMESCPS